MAAAGSPRPATVTGRRRTTTRSARASAEARGGASGRPRRPRAAGGGAAHRNRLRPVDPIHRDRYTDDDADDEADERARVAQQYRTADELHAIETFEVDSGDDDDDDDDDGNRTSGGGDSGEGSAFGRDGRGRRNLNASTHSVLAAVSSAHRDDSPHYSPAGSPAPIVPRRLNAGPRNRSARPLDAHIDLAAMLSSEDEDADDDIPYRPPRGGRHAACAAAASAAGFDAGARAGASCASDASSGCANEASVMGSCWQRTAGAGDSHPAAEEAADAAMPWLRAIPRDGYDGERDEYGGAVAPGGADAAAPLRAARSHDERRQSREYQYEYGYGDLGDVETSGEFHSTHGMFAGRSPPGSGDPPPMAPPHDDYDDFDEDDVIARAAEEFDDADALLPQQRHPPREQYDLDVAPTPPSSVPPPARPSRRTSASGTTPPRGGAPPPRQDILQADEGFVDDDWDADDF